jgi:hypothetical protein
MNINEQNDFIKENAYDYFRKLVSFIYREVGILKEKNHPELYKKSKMVCSGFAGNRKKKAKEIYHLTKNEISTQAILKFYEEQTNLTLNEIYEIFAKGDWLLGRTCYSFGGPRWAEVTKTALDLKEAIDSENWDSIYNIIKYIKKLQHNNGSISEKFKELDQ